MKLLITVVANDAATSTRQAQALQRLLQEEGPQANIERIRTNDETLDGGATLELLLASSVLLELARCLRMFLLRYKTSEVIITDEHGSVTARNVSAATVDKVIQEWSNRRDVD